MALSIKGGETRVLLSVDEIGNVTKRQIGRDRVLLDWIWKRALTGYHTTEVSTPPQAVFDRIIRVGFVKEGEGHYGPSAIHGVNEPLQLGSTFAITHSNHEGTFTNVFEVLELVPNELLVYENQSGLWTTRSTWSVEPLPSGCRISSRNEWTRLVNYRFHPFVTIVGLLLGTMLTATFWILALGVFVFPFGRLGAKWDARSRVRRIKKQAEA